MRLQTEIYPQIDRKFRDSNWNSSASEAHGILSALACRGICTAQLPSKTWLFQMSDPADIDLLSGLYEIILQELQSDNFTFNLLLPQASVDQKVIEALADWCNGFLQGFWHDSEHLLTDATAIVRESLRDMMEISRMEIATYANQESERQLCDIEEHLRVATQVIFDELKQPTNTTNATNTSS